MAGLGPAIHEENRVDTRQKAVHDEFGSACQRMSAIAINAPPVDPVELAAELIRRPSVTPKDEGALDIVAARLERLGFVCHRLVFDDAGPNGEPTAPIVNLYARYGNGRPNLCFAGH